MINSFSGEYDFLSNYYNVDIVYDGVKFHSTEAAFQAAKTEDADMRQKFSQMSPSEAKKTGRGMHLRRGWDSMKDKVMYDVCLIKFTSNETLKERLLDTGDEELIEGNRWHDNYWGDCGCPDCSDFRGRNKLGKTLMRIRDEIRDGRV